VEDVLARFVERASTIQCPDRLEGTGAVGAAVVGMVLLGEAATLSRLLPIGLVAVGIVWLALGD
jgi:hypothetical protein